MHHAPHHPQAPPSHHPGHPGHDPHLHYALPPSHHTPLGAAPPPSAHHGMKRSPESAGLDMMSPSGGGSSDDDEGSMHDVKPNLGSERGSAGRGQSLKGSNEGPPAGKKTKGRVKIKMEFIDNKLRRYTTFSKRKTGIMKKAYELSTLTGTQVMLLVASETGHVYTFATRKLQPMITSDAGKALIQTCLNSPDPPQTSAPTSDQRMSASGYEETELTYNAIADAAAAAAAADAAEQQKDAPEDDEEEEEEEEEEEIEVQDQEEENNPESEDENAIISGPSSSNVSSSGRPLFSTTSNQESITIHPSSSKTSTSISSSGHNLPPEVISQLLATGHLVKEDGTLVRLSALPSTSVSGTSILTAKDLSKKSSKK